MGVALTDLAGLANVITKTDEAIKKITAALNSAFANEIVIQPFTGWIFLTIIVLCCLPAYNTTTSE